MKKIVIALILISVFVFSASAQKKKNDPVGKWKIEAPRAPEGFNTGVLDVTSANKTLSALMSFDGNGSSFPGEKINFAKDTLSYSLYIDGQEIIIGLKFIEPLKMEGKAWSSEGEIPLSLTKLPEEKTNK